VTAGQEEPATEQHGFYVSIQRARRGGIDTGLLLGPYDSKEEAETHVPEGRQLAERVDPRAVFDAFGVSRVTSPQDHDLPAGVLNALAEAGLPEPVVAAYRHQAPGASPEPPGPAEVNPAGGSHDLGQYMEL
jgi:hypothetical protein